MFSHFFIDRPIFATVLSIVIVIVGAGRRWRRLPIAQYPEVAPPTVQVTATYPGANAKVVAETVATPIEQEVNGVEHMLYMSSQVHQRRPDATSTSRSSWAPTSTWPRCWCRTACRSPRPSCPRK